MKMFFKLKSRKQLVLPGSRIAANDGELIFYCYDDLVYNNKGRIRIKVVVGPLRKAKAKRLPVKKAIFSVGAKNNEGSPILTGIHLKKGQKFILNPSRSDSWYGGGSMRGRSTGFRGYPGRGNWMKMFFKLKDHKQAVSPGNHIAANDGELIFYCFDGQVYDNKGRIRVKVVVSPY